MVEYISKMRKIRNKLFDTNPCTLHFPSFKLKLNSKNIDFFNKVYSYFWYEGTIPPLPDELTLVTFNNRDYPTVLESMCHRHNIDIIVVGKNITDWYGISKIKALLDCIDKINTRYLLALDGDDLLIVGDLQKTIDLIQTPIAIGCEPHGPWPLRSRVQHKVEINRKHESPYRYINGGQYILDMSYAKDILNELYNINLGMFHGLERAREQARLYELFIQKPHLFTLDVKCRAFQVVPGRYDYDEVISI
jgi:hypothetical protein